MLKLNKKNENLFRAKIKPCYINKRFFLTEHYDRD